jgi:hypothetical protein
VVKEQGADDAAHRLHRHADLPTDHDHRLMLPSERENPGDLLLARPATLQGQLWLLTFCGANNLVDLADPNLELGGDGATAQPLPPELDDCAAQFRRPFVTGVALETISRAPSRTVVEARSVANLANTASTVCG